MGTCETHAETETPYLCMKHQTYMCGDCLRCRDPRTYCKFRTACPIHFLMKNGETQEGRCEDEG